MGRWVHCIARPISSAVRECMMANSPQAIPATDSAAMAKNKFSHVLPLIPISKCGSAIVAHAPITIDQMNVTRLMNTRRKKPNVITQIVAAYLEPVQLRENDAVSKFIIRLFCRPNLQLTASWPVTLALSVLQPEPQAI